MSDRELRDLVEREQQKNQRLRDELERANKRLKDLETAANESFTRDELVRMVAALAPAFAGSNRTSNEIAKYAVNLLTAVGMYRPLKP